MGGYSGYFKPFQLNLPVWLMKFRVDFSMFLLLSVGRSLSPYNKIWTIALFGRLFIRTYGHNKSETPARRSRR